MPFPRPTLTALRTQAMQDITASDLPNADGFLRRAALRVLAWVQAGLAYLHYGYLDWIARQSVPYTATGEFLEAWAALAPTPVTRNAPQAAVGTGVTFTSSGSTPVPAGTPMTRQDGTQYQTTAEASGSSGTVTVSIQALIAGSAGNSDPGTPLTLATVIPGVVSASGIAVNGIGGGTDLETDTSLRSRMLESYANPPAGGDDADYVTWALQLPGVTRAWTLPLGMGAGTVSVFFMMDATEAANGGFPQGTNGVATLEARDTPATGDQLALANWLYPRRPATALVYAVAPLPQPQAFTISGLSGATAAQKAQVSAVLASLLVQKGSPLAATSIDQSDVDGSLNAISGLPPFAVVSPSSWPITPALGSLFTLGMVSFP